MQAMHAQVPGLSEHAEDIRLQDAQKEATGTTAQDI